MMDRKDLPDLHRQAKVFKNRLRLKHDGGRAWIKDGQLQEARAGANYTLQTITSNINQLDDAGRKLIEKKAGELVDETDTGRKM